MKINVLAAVAFLFLLVTSCSDKVIHELDDQLMDAIHAASPTGDADFFILADGSSYTEIPNQDPRNPLTSEKVELGRMLFFETALAQDPIKENCHETYSCSSCHMFLPADGCLDACKVIADGAEGFGDNRYGHEENWIIMKRQS